MTPDKKLKQGQLVEITTSNQFIAEQLKKKGITVLGTVLNCRYKSDVYYVYSPNNPFGGAGSHWYMGNELRPLVLDT